MKVIWRRKYRRENRRNGYRQLMAASMAANRLARIEMARKPYRKKQHQRNGVAESVINHRRNQRRRMASMG
jgi:hypothetical protein